MLHFRQAGQGKPLVLIHGLFGSLENLGALARLLAENFTVYSVDLPNHGRSPHCDGGDLTFMAEKVNQWRQEIGLSQCVLVGHSLGGKVAMELALTWPNQVTGLVAIDIAPISYPPRHDDVFAGLQAVAPTQLNSRNEADAILEQHITEPAVRSFLLKNLVKEDNGFRWRMNLADLSKQYQQLIRANRLSNYSGPVLFLKGSQSDYIKPAHQEPILQRFPQAQSKIIADTGHWLHAEKPDLTAAVIKKFLRAIPEFSSTV